jgi:hypothetical protein
MARQSHDPYSRYVGVQDHGSDLQDPTRWAARPTHGGTDNYETVPLVGFEHHDWLRLERTGDTFIGSSSADGSTWIEQGRQLWTNAPQTVLLGLEVCSHMDCSPATIVFDGIDYTGGNGQPGSVSDGGTISWNVPRAALDAGISYRVTAEGNKLAGFEGTSDGVAISGDGSFAISAVQDLPGELSLAHDIGAPCAAGSTAFDPTTGEYAVTGSGTDIWQGGDQFQFAYREITGDFFVAVAHIKERQWADGSRWGKVGIMARQDCTARSRYAMMQDHGVDPQDQTRFAARPTQGGADNFEQWTLGAGNHRDWLRLDRSGSVFKGYTSTDGLAWELTGSVDFGATAPPTVLLGLGVCSHTGCAPATIVFDNFKIVTEVNNPPVACIETDPSPATAVLTNGKAELLLKGTCSTDGDGGTQPLSYLWIRSGGPAIVAIENRTAAVTKATFTKIGNYKIRLTVDDLQLVNNSKNATVDVVITDKPPSSTFRRGDVDANGSIEVTDVVVLLAFLFLGGGEPPCVEAGDTDDSGALDITDAITNLGYQFLGDPPPAAPGPFTCGADPVPPDLGCQKACP